MQQKFPTQKTVWLRRIVCTWKLEMQNSEPISEDLDDGRQSANSPIIKNRIMQKFI